MLISSRVSTPIGRIVVSDLSLIFSRTRLFGEVKLGGINISGVRFGLSTTMIGEREMAFADDSRTISLDIDCSVLDALVTSVALPAIVSVVFFVDVVWSKVVVVVNMVCCTTSVVVETFDTIFGSTVTLAMTFIGTAFAWLRSVGLSAAEGVGMGLGVANLMLFFIRLAALSSPNLCFPAAAAAAIALAIGCSNTSSGGLEEVAANGGRARLLFMAAALACVLARLICGCDACCSEKDDRLMGCREGIVCGIPVIDALPLPPCAVVSSEGNCVLLRMSCPFCPMDMNIGAVWW